MLDSWKQVESFENQSTKQIPKTNLLKTLRICDPRYETNPYLFCKAQIKSFWSQDLWLRYKTNPWIRETNPRFYESLIRFLHPYKFSIFYWRFHYVLPCVVLFFTFRLLKLFSPLTQKLQWKLFFCVRSKFAKLCRKIVVQIQGKFFYLFLFL